MDMSDFSERNLRRCVASDGFNHPLATWTLNDWLVAVLGELGEAANIAKKLKRAQDGIPGNKLTPDALREAFKRELADTYIYLDLTAQAAGFRLGEVVEAVFEAKSRELEYEG